MNLFSFKNRILSLGIISTLALCGSLGGQEVDYSTEVQPLLQKYCAACHNEADSEGEFVVDSYDSIMSGGDSDEVVIPGERNSSLMYLMMTGEVLPEMPPGDHPQLTEDQIELVGRWIDQGANAPAREIVRARLPVVNVESQVDPAITSADWSPGNQIAVASFGQVRVIDPEVEQDVEVSGFPGKVNSVRFTAGGERLVVGSGSAGRAGEATIWRFEGLVEEAFANDHTDILYSAVVSPDGRWLATAGYDRKIVIRDLESDSIKHELSGHNDAVYDLDFSPDSTTLISASGDQTVKVWDVESGGRLDTLGQPLEEQFATCFSPDGNLIAGAGRDNRIRIWQFTSRGITAINPILHARFAHEGPIVALEFSPDGKWLISSAEDMTIKVWDTESFRQQATFENQSDVVSAVAISPDSRRIFAGRLDGSFEFFDLPVTAGSGTSSPVSESAFAGTAVEALPRIEFDESEPNDLAADANVVEIPAIVSGVIHSESRTDLDQFSFTAVEGQELVLEVKAARDNSPLDSRIEILNQAGDPVPQIVLRAVRDSYFTFRGKDSNNSNDFRIHNWEEMGLNDYLYANGEVVKLFLYPRGPDSGFKVYPGYGKRYSFFGTTPLSHPLHEPCYVVRPYPVGTEFPPNGLPVFRLNYENDDDPLRRFGNDSRMFFTAPEDGRYFVRVSDVRGFSGEDFHYKLIVRPPEPDFSVRFGHRKDLRKGSGQEFSVTANRQDGFDGPIEVVLENVPPSVSIASPLIIESGHNQAFGTIHLAQDADAPTAEEFAAIKLAATATVAGRAVTHDVNGFEEVVIHDQPKIQVRILPINEDPTGIFEQESPDKVVLEIAPGQRIQARVVANRINHENRISFGNEDSGRNLPHGVYVDDIGLNGLMITRGNSEQTFFIKAEDWVQPTTRTFHIRANDVDGEASLPVEIRVLPDGR
ncbi:MAG: c-type cytochrome domain-containing protein [Planctomycetota bacterium]